MAITRMLTAPTWTKKPSSGRLRAGFSLIELLGVLVIIGLIASLVYPRLASLGLAELRSAGRRLQGMVQLSFNLAVMEKAPYRLAVDLDSQCFWAEKNINGEWVVTNLDLLGKVCLPDSVAIDEFEVLDRKLVRNGLEYVYFSDNGFVEPARFVLVNRDDAGFTLFTDPTTGRVKVFDGRVNYAR
jgi:prepilin-type N-terminal cleavage/methylation domain-containing protein